jgi:hypothetical protein
MQHVGEARNVHDAALPQVQLWLVYRTNLEEVSISTFDMSTPIRKHAVTN